MPYTGYTIQELTKLFRRSKQALNQAGILDQIKKHFPFGPKFPLYDVEDVEVMNEKLVRYDGMVALGIIPRQHGRGKFLINNIIITSEFDCDCPICGSFSVFYPYPTKRIWCPNCQIINQKNKAIT